MRQKNNIPADAGNFLRTEKDSKDFKNEKLSTKIRRDETQKPYFFERKYSKTSWNHANILLSSFNWHREQFYLIYFCVWPS